MTEAGPVSEADRATTALARTDGFFVPVEPESYEGIRGPALDALTAELESLHADLEHREGDRGTAAAVAARLGRCRAVRFVLAGDPADRERALPLLTEARTSALLGEEERQAADRDLMALIGSRLVRLNREVTAGRPDQWFVDRALSLAALGTPLAQGGSGVVEDSALFARLLLERGHPRMTPELRANLEAFGEMTDALLTGDTATLVRGAQRLVGTMPDGALPPPLNSLPWILGQMERSLDTSPQPDATGGAPADDADVSAEVRHTLTQYFALAEVMSPGTIDPEDVSRLLAELSGGPGTAGQEGGAPLPSRMVAALVHVALATRTGDMQGFREALRLMHEASDNGELDSRTHGEWLRVVVPGVLIAAALTGGSLSDEDMARDLFEAQQWDGDPSSPVAATLRLCGETVRLHVRLMSALHRGDVTAVEDVVDAMYELELDETYDAAEEWTGVLTGFVLGTAYLGRVVLDPASDDRLTDLRAAVHHLQRAVETSVDMPVMQSLLDITWAPLLTLTAIVESDPSRIAEGVRRARAALENTGFTSDFRPRARGGIALALDTLHLLTGDTAALDEAIAELTQALAELPDGGPGGAGLTWDLAALRAKRATLAPGTPGAADDLRAAVGLARASLRLSADDVLLQQGVGRGLRIARAAADRGRRAAFWALGAGLTEEAIGCLEAGRSLVLGAAAVSAGVADRLAALGEGELAERWKAAAESPGEHGDGLSFPPLSADTDTFGRLRDRSPLEMLSAAGAGGSDLPGDLRRRSLDVLRGRDGAEVHPVPASVSDLRAGLRESRADALLYLVPGVEGPDGAVLVVTGDGPVTVLPLPGLAAGGRGPVTDYLAAGADRQRLEAAAGTGTGQEAEDRAEARWLRALDGLCAWAGGVLGPALDHLDLWDRAMTESGLGGGAWTGPGSGGGDSAGPGSGGGDSAGSGSRDGDSAGPGPRDGDSAGSGLRGGPGRVAGPAGAGRSDAVRLVIVPCGDLGVVPWQAAVLPVPGGYGAGRPVRACEIAVLTHAASGREFLRAAARRRMALAERPALVFHGADDLAWAEEEIDTLADVHYPDAVVHRPHEDPATPETVLALLGGRSDAPASLVHLACHGLAGPDPTRSALRLAGAEPDGTGGELTLSTLLEVPAEGDAFRSAGPLVVCGGCETDLTTRDHDEALTVTSVLVHRLAADAIGSRWKVDDMRSELLMLVLHDALAKGLAPPDALRAAQRWMLAPPDERPPVAALKDISAVWRLTEDLRDRPDTWAAFVHHGNPAPATARQREGERV
ncbi:CHAT domain-containing protein [Streptomyces naphthomycinicus]|uniref:CHAT domain-containing protein n=1 Tax=Streptomyces naphthomycinicus TaxID=2872625 RepID=UPI001CECD3C2|nr:CHAT domain-containing protein [Streptomyces sp. TML10]